MSRSEDLHDHYLIPEEVINLFPNEDGLSYEELLFQQESMYRSFQERPGHNNMDIHDDGANDPGHRVMGAAGGEGRPVATPSKAQASSSNARQDSDDPDGMEDEELPELTESVGLENKGIPASRISELPTSKYKSGGLFSKYMKKEKCVICQMDFHSGEQLITLACLHRYHSKCISDLLMLKNNCPKCQKEVV